MVTGPEPAGAAHAGRRGEPLNRQRVLSAALRVVDNEGYEALTMRRLGRELGRDPMALYRYAPNRAALLDGVVEQVLDQLEVPDGDGDWAAQLRSSTHAFRRLALTHPDVVPLLVTRPPATPLGLRSRGVLQHLEQTMTLLTGAGFSPADALRTYRALVALVCGHVLAELQETTPDPEDSADLLRIHLRNLPTDEFPHVRGLAGELAHYDGAAELDHGLDVFLAGLPNPRP